MEDFVGGALGMTRERERRMGGRRDWLSEERGSIYWGGSARLQLQVIRLSTSPLVVDTATPHLRSHAHWQPTCERPRIQNNPIIGRLRNDNWLIAAVRNSQASVSCVQCVSPVNDPLLEKPRCTCKVDLTSTLTLHLASIKLTPFLNLNFFFTSPKIFWGARQKCLVRVQLPLQQNNIKKDLFTKFELCLTGEVNHF